MLVCEPTLLPSGPVISTGGQLDALTTHVPIASLGRVDLGGFPPRPPTDPGLRVKRTRLFILCLRYAAPEAVDHTSRGKTVTLL